MDYRDEEYLNLFKKIKEQNTENNNYQMLKETPNYDNYNLSRSNNFQNLNEVQRNPYVQDYNLNEFNIETRVNGQLGKEEKLNEIMQRNKLERERLNEIKIHEEQKRLEEQRKLEEQRRQEQQEFQKLNEVVDFKDSDIITLEMFERARYNSMMMVAKRILPK